MDKSRFGFQVKAAASRLGFEHTSFTPLEPLQDEARYLENWLKKGTHGQMGYIEHTFDERIDPTKLLPGARTAICLLKNYYPAPELAQRPDLAKVSRYARGRDYHHVLKERLYRLIEEMKVLIGSEFSYRLCVDSAPVMEKVWAKRAGLGWMGKHTNLIRKQNGSYFFIGLILTDLVFESPSLTTDHCGTCTRCIDACPTQALTPYEIDAQRCISYLTIETKEAIPAEFADKLENWAFGCDICQEVCPWNRFAIPTLPDEFPATPEVLNFTLSDWAALTNTQHKKRLAGSPLSRIPRKKWLQNLHSALRIVSSESSNQSI